MSSKICVFISLSLFLLSCTGKKTAPANQRLVVQSFENLGPSRAADAWAAGAAESLSWALVADPHILASSASDAEQARQSEAGFLLRGQLRPAAASQQLLTVQLTDNRSGALLAQADFPLAESSFIPAACQALLSFVSRHLPVSSGRQCFGSAEDWQALSAASALPELLERRPRFWPAYLRLGQTYAREGKRAELQALAARFPPDGDPPARFARGQLLILAATTPAERLAAYEAALSVRSREPRLLLEAAQLAQTLRRWDLATQYLQALLRLHPARPGEWNSLGYSWAQLGKTDSAVQAILEYRKQSPNEANPWDSLGEVQYMGRRFREAAVAFDELQRRFPDFQNRQCLWKSAIAWYRAGNLAEADKRHQQWLAPLAQRLSPSNLAFQRAYWFLRTGRAAEAARLWEKEWNESTGERRIAAELHRAVLDFGVNGKVPPRAQFVAWSQALTDPALRQDFAIFGLLSENAGSVTQWQQKILSAVGPARMPLLGSVLLAAAQEIWAPPAAEKPVAEPLPENPPGVIEGMLLRRRMVVLR